MDALEAIKRLYPDYHQDLVVKHIQKDGLLDAKAVEWLRTEMGLLIARIPRVTLAGFPLGSFEVLNGMYCYPADPIDEYEHMKHMEREEYYRSTAE